MSGLTNRHNNIVTLRLYWPNYNKSPFVLQIVFLMGVRAELCPLQSKVYNVFGKELKFHRVCFIQMETNNNLSVYVDL